ASRWRTRSPGPRASSKGSCGPEKHRAAGPRLLGRVRQPLILDSRAPSDVSRQRCPVPAIPCQLTGRGVSNEGVSLMAETALRAEKAISTIPRRTKLRRLLQRKSTVAFLMTLPLILLIALLVIYPAFYSLHLATLNKSMQRFVGFGNFTFLFKRETFWMVVQQSCIFAITAVILKAIIGFVVAHFVHNIPAKGPRKWRGMRRVPWAAPPAMSCVAWLWLFDPSYSAFNWVLALCGIDPIPWTGETFWARLSVILVNVWIGAPFFMIMYLAALKS